MINPGLARVQPPPIMEVQGWLRAHPAPADRPLLNLAQAAPADPPPMALREVLADAMLNDPAAHAYGPVLGNPALRAEIAAQWSAAYGGQIAPDNVAVTAGCNQAFCVAVATACAPGDAVLLPAPWYFNHAMWLGMSGIDCLPVPCGPDMLPDLAAAEALMTDRVRALVLVTPNNPTGAEYPPALLAGFHDLARDRGAVLIVDETYRDVHSAPGAPHGLFGPGWEDTLIHLYSFSKVFRLMGHRTGAMIAGATRIAEAEKFLDTMTICASQPGQIAALAGLRTLGQWVAGERAEILSRRERLHAVFARDLPGWRILSSGAYFAWVEPPRPVPGLARRLLAEQSVLCLPGTMFLPEGADSPAIRIAYANAGAEGIDLLARRLAAFAM